MSSGRKLTISLLLGLGLPAAALLSMRFVSPLQAERRQTSDGRALAVRTQTLEAQSFQPFVAGYGSATPVRRTVVSSEVSGRVAWVDDRLRVGGRLTAPPPSLAALRARFADLRRQALEAEMDAARAAWEDLPPLVRQIVALRREHAVLRIEDDARIEAESAAAAQVRQALAQWAQAGIELQTTGRLLALAARDVELARAELERVRPLVARGGLPQSAEDSAEMALQRAESAYEQLQGRKRRLPVQRQALEQACRLAAARYASAARGLMRTCVTMPFDGVVSSRQVEPGTVVQGGGGMPATVLFAAYADEEMEVALNLPVSSATPVRVGQRVRLSDQSGRTLQGKVARVGAEVDPLNRTLPVFVRAPARQDDVRLRPGAFLRGEILIAEDALAVVPVALRHVIDDAIFVVAERDGKTVAARVRPDVLYRRGNRLLADPGTLPPGTRLITSHQDVLGDGMPIRPLAGSPGQSESDTSSAGER